MLSALIKAFTGRAGGLGSLLALLIVALIAYTVVDRLPKVEQQVLAVSQDYLAGNMAADDVLKSLQADGRDVHLGGEFQNPAALKAGIESLNGVRKVFLSGSELSDVDASDGALDVEPVEGLTAELAVDSLPVNALNEISNEAGEASTAQVVEAVTELLLKDGSGRMPVASITDTKTRQAQKAADATNSAEIANTGANVNFDPTAPDEGIVPEVVTFDESSLALRYDGTQLKLSGHVGDEKMAELLVEAVRQAIPSYSVLTSDVDGNGKSSPLNWMRRFLRIASGLPEDAQGLISGSDSKGVQIIPDEQQTLSAKDDSGRANVNESREASPARVGLESVAQEQASLQPPAPKAEAETEEELSEGSQMHLEKGQLGQGSNELKGELTASSPPTSGPPAMPPKQTDPGEFIVALNTRLLETAFFQPGEVSISEALAQELDHLVQFMQQHPSIYLRIMGNIDSSVGARFEELVGMDRARQVRRYLLKQQLDGARIITAPLPGGYAFDRRVQLVFYISE